MSRRVSAPLVSNLRPTVCRTLDRCPRPSAARVSVNTSRTRRSPTLTPNTCVAVNPSGSVAVTVTVAAPRTTADSVRVEPDTVVTVAAGFDDSAVYVNASPSTSVKYGASSTVAGCPPSSSAWSGITPTASGASLTGHTVSVTVAVSVSPPGSATV